MNASTISSRASDRPAALGGTPVFDAPVYVTRSLVPDRVLFEREIEAVFDRQWYTNDGPVVRKLEAWLRNRLEVGFCAAFSSGTMALQAALRSLDLSGEVITTPFTFPATVHAIRWNGLEPVFCDIDPETYNLDPTLLGPLVSSRTSALLPVHVYGNPCDVEAIDVIAKQHGLKVVYDAAHAFGARYRGRSIGSYGDLSAFSFHATKIFHTAEGGAVTGGDDEARDRLALLRNFGIVNEDEVSGVGVNGKLSELHAALGLAVIDAAEREMEERKALVSQYEALLAEIPGVGRQRRMRGSEPSGYNFAIEFDPEAFGLNRDQVHTALAAENIVTRKYFYPLCSENQSYRDLPSAAPERLPHAHRLAERILCLPMYGALGREGVERVVEALLRVHAHAGELAGVDAG
jgi:dTDP-4-amino-4,6-dideoxygalactose transaminase